jgi:hypothetical protein
MGEAAIGSAIPLYLLGAMSSTARRARLVGAFNAVRITLPVLYWGIVLLAVAGSLTFHGRVRPPAHAPRRWRWRSSGACSSGG